jgi:hypothetical protein
MGALADCGNTTAAVVRGQFQFRATVHYFNGTPPATFTFGEGHQGTDTGLFTSTCPSVGNCTVVLARAGAGAGFNGGGTGIYISSFAAPLTQLGSDYSVTFPSDGFGGPNLPPCAPPPIAYVVHIHVVAAERDAAGAWTAAYLTGSEDNIATWTCAGSVGVAAVREHLVFEAVPAGRAFPSSAAAACPTPAASPGVLAAGTTQAGATQNPDQSTISTALASPASSFSTLGHAAGNALITLGIVLLITFPASVFNKTLEENYDDIRDIMQRRVGWLGRLSTRVAAGASHGRDAAIFALVVLVGSAVGGLNDPKFGFNGASLETYAAVILAVLFGTAVGTTVGFLYRRIRHHGVTARLTALPAGLVVAGLCVLVSRLTSFQPGYLYGVICGVAFAAALPGKEDGHVVAISSLATLALGVVAWFIWVPVKHAAERPGASPLTVIAGNFLAAVFVGGLVGSVLGLVPLRFLPGGTLVRWSRVAWSMLFGLAVFGLLQVMLRPESSSAHSGTTAVITAGVLFVLFGGLSVAFRVYFARRARRRAAAASPA